MAPICVDNFYSPVSMSGYLTPLQRKKLRERRNIVLSCVMPVKKTMPVKKKEFKASMKMKRKCKPTKKVPMPKLSNAGAPVFECSVSKIIGRGSLETFKEKRFFKTRCPEHLTKAVFSLPLQRKRIRLNFGPDINDTDLHKHKTKSSYSTGTQVLHSPDFKKRIETSSFDASSPYNVSDESVEKSSFQAQNCEVIDNLKQENENHFAIDFQFPSDEELLQLQAKAREEQQKLLDLKSQKSVESSPETSPKFYSIFTTPFRKIKEPNDQTTPKRNKKIFLDTSKGTEQMIIDAGQKEIGAKVCPECGMPYFRGQREDERLHICYHNSFSDGLTFRGWKKEHVLATFEDGRIIQVKKTDERYKLKRVENVISITNRDLGFSDIKLKDEMKLFLFISNEKKIGGFLVAEHIEKASEVVLGEDGNCYASSKLVSAECGINRIWVSEKFRRQKVATRLVDCLRQNFEYGRVIDSQKELAFTDTSPDGREFASAYTGTDNFLVYISK